MIKVGDLVTHIRDNEVVGIVVAIPVVEHDALWADVWWNGENRPFKERWRNLTVVS